MVSFGYLVACKLAMYGDGDYVLVENLSTIHILFCSLLAIMPK
jgi:hypothetical protein